MPDEVAGPADTPEGPSTTVSRVIDAPRPEVYRAFLDPDAVVAWLPPDGMTGRVHQFDPREGGEFCVSLTYRDATGGAGGKTTPDTDTHHGRFVSLVPDERIEEIVEFESDDPRFAGEMRITVTFADAADGTAVTYRCDDIPSGIRPEDNEAGCRSSLRQLAVLLE